MQRLGLREQSTIAVLVAFDLAWAVVAYAIAFFIRIWLPVPFTADFLPPIRIFELHHMLPQILLTEVVILYFFGFYDLRALRAGLRPIVDSVTALFVHLLAITALYFFAGDVNFPRSVLVLYWLVNASGLALMRDWAGRRLAATSPVRVVLVGTRDEIDEFLGGVGSPRLHHVDVVGAVTVEPEEESIGRAAAAKSTRLTMVPASTMAAGATSAGAATHGTVLAFAGGGVGAGSAPAESLARRRSDGAGARGPSGERSDAPARGFDPRWLGTLADLPRLLEELDVAEIVLLSPLSWRDRLVDGLLRQARRPRVSVVPSVYDILVGRISSGRIHDVPLVEVVKNPRDDIAYVVKRGTDFAAAGVLALLTAPVVALAAIAIKLTSRGPIFFRQRRVGEGGLEFVMWKLRTMADGAEEESGPVIASVGDRRVTPVGRLLRASRIDELPQLLNVLNGTMSLVGPRPERPEFVRRFAQEIPGYLERFQVKPGLTGLAQVNGEYHTSAAYKLKYDLAYIYNYSLILDLKIMAETIKVMVTRRGV